ncbi:MAG: hypothetical protein K2X27_13720 [Candidatus Obscuribacterales bacterium]|nr:hypothetical protein [Candidatus Obscuribacterales bacterium]
MTAWIPAKSKQTFRKRARLQFAIAACMSLLSFSGNAAFVSAAFADESAKDSSEAGSEQPQIAVSNTSKGPLLRGGVVHDVCPFKEDGSTEVIEQGTALNLTVTANLNSELSKEGDEIRAEVSTDLKDGGKVLLPGKWQVIGHVSHVQSQKRMGKDGYIEIKFDKLVSPDGKWVVPLDASASTKDSTAKTVVKQVAETTGYVSVGAVGGALLSVQLTGLPLAVATHGISVGAGAAAGAALGIAAALRRKGDILCALPGDEIQIRLPAPITLPAFKQETIPSKAPPPKLSDLDIVVKKKSFQPFPFGDRKSRLLTVSFLLENHSNKEYSLADIAVVCNHNHSYLPYCATPGILKERNKTVGPNAVQEATLTFQVGDPRLKYSLVLLQHGTSHILSQVAIN